jgi:hypothetical protein
MRSLVVCSLISVTVAASALRAEQEEQVRSFASPDGRFALKVNVPNEESADAKLEVIEKASGKVVGDLGTDYASIISRIKVVWSADSKRLAYRTAGQKEWHTSVYFWNGSVFCLVPLPEDLPTPEIKFRKTDGGGGVKNYGGGEEPVRWLKSGDLELSSQLTEMARASSRTYTATLTIMISFDPQDHASVKSVTKSKTRLDE